MEAKHVVALIVGGLTENPGVYGHGGGIIIVNACLALRMLAAV